MKILKGLSEEARELCTFNKIKIPLISVAKLCGSECTVIFLKSKTLIIHENKIIATAPRDCISKLWTIKLNNLNDCQSKYDKDLAMNITVPEESQSNIEKLIMFRYEAIGFLIKTTLIKVIKKGRFATWPGLIVQRVKKYVKKWERVYAYATSSEK